MQQTFTIGSTEFGIGRATLKIEAGTMWLEIWGDEAIADQIADDESHPFGWILFPPNFYARAVPYETDGAAKVLHLTDETLDDYDIALYLLEHNDAYGTVRITDNDGTVTVEGTAYANGEELPLRIRAAVS